MPLQWPGLQTVYGDLPEGDRPAIQSVLDEVATAVESGLSAIGLPRHASPLFRPWNLAVVRDPDKFLVVFAPGGGMPSLYWIEQAARLAATALADWARNEQGWDVAVSMTLPLPNDPARGALVSEAAQEHVAAVEQQQALGKLGDLKGLPHLVPHLREFLRDHPDYDRNVFLMMRFAPTPQLSAVHAAIQKTLSDLGFHCVRADDRDYTGDVWSNIEVHLSGCRYGIAVFEDIDQRDFNPNVSLELGYMMGLQKRCLILKEKRLPQMPADVVHKLYKTWDAFNIEETVSAEVTRWIDVDLGHRTR